MPVYIIWKNNTPKKGTDSYFTTGKTAQNWESLVIHIYINLWAFVNLYSLFSAFSDPVCIVFLNLLEMAFPTRDHTTVFEKIDDMPIFCMGPWDTDGPW